MFNVWLLYSGKNSVGIGTMSKKEMDADLDCAEASKLTLLEDLVCPKIIVILLVG